MARVRVALIAAAESSFVSTDRRLLEETFLVRYVPWNGKRSIPALVGAIARSDVAFAWFALDHAYGACRIARLLGRKSVVMVGGADAARVPGLGYGVHLDPVRGRRSAYAMAHADRLLVVDDALRGEIERNAGIQRPDVLTVPLGFDTERFFPDGGPRTTVLTVGVVDGINLRRKGLETFVRAARLLPDLPFLLIGGRPNSATQTLRSMAPPNLRILDRVSEDGLIEAYRRARVYVQLSEYEAFGSSVGEAMACGCIPVGTRVGGIPTLIGDAGVYAPVGDPGGAADAIRAAYGREGGAAARSRILETFPLERRRRALREVVEGLAHAPPR
jgi:glycosyltransferase involved in cell wall biosynthesis